MMFFSLRLKPKITFGTLFILMLCMVITGTSFTLHERKRLLQAKTIEGESLAALVAHISEKPIKNYIYFILQDVAQTVEQSPNVAFCEIYDVNGQSLVQTDTTIHGTSIEKKTRRIDDSVLIIETLIKNDEKILGKVEIGLELAPLKQDLQNHILGVAIAIILILIFAGISINLFLSHSFVSPVVSLRHR